MILSLLLHQPLLAVIWILAIVLALTVHEFSHAAMAKHLGDETAERTGRLTLNPLAHIDPMGFLSMVVLGFGWAKPVPYNPYHLKNPSVGGVMIGLAGPLSNGILAIVSAGILRWMLVYGQATTPSLLEIFLLFSTLLNLMLMIFNVIPVPPLDGSQVFFAAFSAPKYAHLRHRVAVLGPQILLGLVLISLVSSFDVFFFVSRPAFFFCDTLLQGSCGGALSTLFSL